MNSTGQVAVTDRDVDSQVRSEMIRRLYTYSFPVHIVSIPAAFLIAALFAEVASPRTPWIWAASLAGVEALRLLACLLFFHLRGHVTAPRLWFALFALGLAAAMPVWGFAGVLFFEPEQPVYQVLVAIMLIGIMGIALPLLAPVLWLYMSSLVVALGPVFVMLLHSRETLSDVTAVLILLAVLVLALAAIRIHRDQVDAVAARHSYASAAESLRLEVDERRKIETELRRRETSSQRRKALLMDLARDPVIADGDLKRAYGSVARKLTRGLALTRVSVWVICSESRLLRCEVVLDGDRLDMEPAVSMTPRFDGNLRRSLRHSRTLVIPDTRSDVNARHYWDDYFKPLGILSVMVTPFRRQGRVRGFVMAESRIQRFWTEDDDNFMSSAVDFISLAMAAADRHKAQHRLQEMATLDSLTRLPNRNAFQEFVRDTLQRAREEGTRVGLLFVDLDRFKAINDSMGHHAGDLVLQEMAQRLLDSTREGDWVARLAGDEFTVIVRNPESLETLRGIANRMRKNLIRPMMLEGTEITLTCSIGISLFPDDADEPERLLQNADAAMYEAKKEGRNRYAFFTPELRERAVRRLNLDTELRRAVEEGAFVLHYQPIVRSDDGGMIGVEALVRWPREDGEMISPGEFIPLAEETGLIVPLGEWVLNEALRQVNEWETTVGESLSVSVNFSMVQCRQGGLPTVVSRALSRHQVSPQRLVAEVTESDVLIGQQQYQATFDRLREQGVRVAMDDFGTGSSSLGQLKRLPVDVLKLDRSFVRDILTSSQDEAITRAAISMANALGLSVVAEGVETEAQRQLLIDATCPFMQGFFFSRPLPAAEISDILTGNQRLPLTG
ncbi:putative bifunctional diguanylate cyclase/phosphodiesterase [Natronospira bacteriovora]|uniref:EAL domain-containing protein n=1 Tax=Natronospira bacteriovora TaxID=3069753 RepID=A0ABU0W5T9_9GAMM|nr:EAL domain-containing protein [Natronospira sp. AB-CW4]MDQ2069366.1 EAL domain-containing protein [Natronospira sp. AB-CW4]